MSVVRSLSYYCFEGDGDIQARFPWRCAVSRPEIHVAQTVPSAVCGLSARMAQARPQSRRSALQISFSELPLQFQADICRLEGMRQSSTEMKSLRSRTRGRCRDEHRLKPQGNTSAGLLDGFLHLVRVMLSSRIASAPASSA
jgi:hypothetical protein